MKRLREKLHSQRGASILLALLLFLVCMLVAASVLAAAASNAGKYRSNRVEQQKYLTVSSAIRLIADEIQKAAYTGKYKVYEWTVPAVIDGDGNVTAPAEDFFYIEQEQGAFKCGDLGGEGETFGNALIPLLKELDAIFNEQFKASSGAGYKTGYGAVSGLNLIDTPQTYTLTVILPDGLGGYPYPGSGPAVYQAPTEVTVQVTLDHSTRHIRLTAWLGTGALADAVDIMSAELVAKGVPTLDNAPAGSTAGSAKPTVELAGSGSPKETAMTWELNWIRKGAA